MRERSRRREDFVKNTMFDWISIDSTLKKYRKWYFDLNLKTFFKNIWFSQWISIWFNHLMRYCKRLFFYHSESWQFLSFLIRFFLFHRWQRATKMIKYDQKEKNFEKLMTTNVHETHNENFEYSKKVVIWSRLN